MLHEQKKIFEVVVLARNGVPKGGELSASPRRSY